MLAVLLAEVLPAVWSRARMRGGANVALAEAAFALGGSDWRHDDELFVVGGCRPGSLHPLIRQHCLKDTYLGLVHGHAAVATKDGRVRSGMLLEALRGRLWRHQLLVVEAEGALV